MSNLLSKSLNAQFSSKLEHQSMDLEVHEEQDRIDSKDTSELIAKWRSTILSIDARKVYATLRQETTRETQTNELDQCVSNGDIKLDLSSLFTIKSNFSAVKLVQFHSLKLGLVLGCSHSPVSFLT
jgi:hypothetical protein